MWFQTIRTALKLAGTVIDLQERLTALEQNFDILDRAVKREGARVRAENSRERRKLEEEPAPGEPSAPTERASAIGGVMKLSKGGTIGR